MPATAGLRPADSRGRLSPQVLLESHDVVAAIDVDDFAGDAARSIRGQEDPGATDFFDLHAAAQGSALLVFPEHLSEACNAAGSKGFDGAGGDRIDSNP